MMMVFFVLSALRLPRELKADIWVNRGDAAFEQRRYSIAAKCYEEAKRYFPHASLVQERIRDVDEDRKAPGRVDRDKVEGLMKRLKQI